MGAIQKIGHEKKCKSDTKVNTKSNIAILENSKKYISHLDTPIIFERNIDINTFIILRSWLDKPSFPMYILCFKPTAEPLKKCMAKTKKNMLLVLDNKHICIR